MNIEEEMRKLGLTNPLEWADLDERFKESLMRRTDEMHNTPYSTNVAQIRLERMSNLLYVLFDNHREKKGPRLYAYTGLQDADAMYEAIYDSSSPGGTVWDYLRRPGMSFQRLS